MINVEKVIRVLGYIVYSILWMPVIILAAVVVPIVWLAMSIREGSSVKDAAEQLLQLLKSSIEHDIEFIKTGKW